MNVPPVQYVKTSDGFSIAFCDSGEGLPFVLLWDMPHGSTELLWKSDTMRSFFESLASRFRLVQLDNRGTGNSTRGLPENHNCDDYVLDVEAVADRLGLADFVLLGPVFSAHTAIRYTLRHPDRVRGLILLNPMSADNPWAGMKLWEDMYTTSWEMFMTTYVEAFYPGGGEDWVNYFRSTATHSDYLRAAQALENSRLEALLPSLTIASLVMASRSPRWPPLLDAAKSYASMLPNSRLVLFDGEQNREMISSPSDGRPSPAMPVLEEFVWSPPQPPERPAAITQLPSNLSDRELDVLRLLAQGKTNPQNAEALFITRNTVQNHVSSILIKTNLNNRAQAAVFAKEHGIV